MPTLKLIREALTDEYGDGLGPSAGLRTIGTKETSLTALTDAETISRINQMVQALNGFYTNPNAAIQKARLKLSHIGLSFGETGPAETIGSRDFPLQQWGGAQGWNPATGDISFEDNSKESDLVIVVSVTPPGAQSSFWSVTFTVKKSDGIPEVAPEEETIEIEEEELPTYSWKYYPEDSSQDPPNPSYDIEQVKKILQKYGYPNVVSGLGNVSRISLQWKGSADELNKFDAELANFGFTRVNLPVSWRK